MSNNSNNDDNHHLKLDDSVGSFTQTINQGMNAVGESAADIEIYMGEQATEMTKGVGNVMNGMGSAMQHATEDVKKNVMGNGDTKEGESK